MTTQTANNSAKTGQIYRKLNEIDENKITFGEPEINKYGGKSWTVKYDGGPLAIQTPRCRLPFGLGKYDETDASGNIIKTKYWSSLKQNYTNKVRKYTSFPIAYSVLAELE